MSELRKEMVENGIHYTLIGDYYFPDFADPDQHGSFGKWADLHHAFLKEHKRAVYLQLLMSNRMIDYLERFNEQAEELYQRNIDQMKLVDGITEELKAKDQMDWVQRINRIAETARELVLHEMVYQ